MKYKIKKILIMILLMIGIMIQQAKANEVTINKQDNLIEITKTNTTANGIMIFDADLTLLENFIMGGSAPAVMSRTYKPVKDGKHYIYVADTEYSSAVEVYEINMNSYGSEETRPLGDMIAVGAIFLFGILITVLLK